MTLCEITLCNRHCASYVAGLLADRHMADGHLYNMIKYAHDADILNFYFFMCTGCLHTDGRKQMMTGFSMFSEMRSFNSSSVDIFLVGHPRQNMDSALSEFLG